MDEFQKIRIRFEFTNQSGDNFINESHVGICYEIGDGELDIIGEQFNTFLKQCGYIRKNDLIFMEDITEEEYDALLGFLDEIRNKGETNEV